MKSLTVFCGSKSGNNPAYHEAATELGRLLSSNGITLVFGGGSEGIMGAVCDGVLQGGPQKGEVIAVIPRFMLEQLHAGVAKVDIVETMHERKFKMAEEGDGFVALPGGIGTLEEITEMITWSALELHSKPVALLNTMGFYDSLLGHWKTMFTQGFLSQGVYERLIVADNPQELLTLMQKRFHGKQ